MKKVIAILGSLLVFAGARSQTVTTVKKETVKPVTTSPVVTDSSQKQIKNSTLKQTILPGKQTNAAIKQTLKTTNSATTIKETAKPLKD